MRQADKTYLERLNRLTKKSRDDIARRGEIGFMVNLYYHYQDNRKRLDQQIETARLRSEDITIHEWALEQAMNLEWSIKQVLKSWIEYDRTATWFTQEPGIAHVIAAGVEAYCDMEIATSPAHLQSYAGLNPNMVWGPKQKRPFNAEFKKLTFNIGESIVKKQNNRDSFYGPLYRQRREYEERNNEAGNYKDQALKKLEQYKNKKDSGIVVVDEKEIKSQMAYYKEGLLPPGHIYARSKRWIVKMILSHWWCVRYWYLHNETKLPPKPYAIQYLGHVDYIDPPRCPFDVHEWHNQ